MNLESNLNNNKINHSPKTKRIGVLGKLYQTYTSAKQEAQDISEVKQKMRYQHPSTI